MFYQSLLHVSEGQGPLVVTLTLLSIWKNRHLWQLMQPINTINPTFMTVICCQFVSAIPESFHSH